MAGKSVEETLGNWAQAYSVIEPTLNSPELKDRLNSVINTPIPQDPEGILVYQQRMNAALGLGRLVAANQRAAATVAALLVQSGIKPAPIDYGDDT